MPTEKKTTARLLPPLGGKVRHGDVNDDSLYLNTSYTTSDALPKEEQPACTGQSNATSLLKPEGSALERKRRDTREHGERREVVLDVAKKAKQRAGVDGADEGG